jgi:hypothetical protein
MHWHAVSNGLVAWYVAQVVDGALHCCSASGPGLLLLGRDYVSNVLATVPLLVGMDSSLVLEAISSGVVGHMVRLQLEGECSGLVSAAAGSLASVLQSIVQEPPTCGKSQAAESWAVAG